MTLRLVTPPATEPVTLAQVKFDAVIDGAESDDLIPLLITAARKEAEKITGRALITQTWELVLDKFPESAIKIGMLPVSAISSVTYYDAANVWKTISAGNYRMDVDTLPGWIHPEHNFTWPTTYERPDAVIVRFVAGYGAAAADVPEPIRLWIRLRAAKEADIGKEQVAITSFVDGLLDGYRLYWI